MGVIDGDAMGFIFFWLIFAVVVSVIAKNKGRSAIAWFLLSVLISPILSLILVLVFKPIEDENISLETDSFRGERVLSNDSYKLFLSKRYGIQKNDVFDKFVCQEKLFITIDEALEYANALELESVKVKKSSRLDDGQIECCKCSGKNPSDSVECRYCRYPLEV